MQFLQPLYVLGALLFGLPIVIHLIGRSRAKVRQFAALELLLRSEKRVARRTKIRQLLLLALRALAIAAVPLILAKPFVEAASDLPAAVGSAQSAVIIVDDSLSMSAKKDGRPLLAEAQARARRIVGALGSDAEAAVLLGSRGGGVPVGEFTADRSRLLHAIDAIQPTHRSTDLSGALKRAAQLLQTASRPEHRVYLLSDMAAHGFDHDLPWAAGRGPDLVVVDVSDGKPPPNHAVTELRIEPAPHLGARGVRISAEIANFSEQPLTDAPLTLRIDGKPVAKGLVSAPPREKVQKRFFHSFSRDDDAIGIHDVQVELAPDDLPDDDMRPARLEIRRDVRVLLVDGDPRTARRDDELFYLETALRPGDRDDSQLEVTTTEDLSRARLADYDVIFLCNVKSVDAGALRDYVSKGGGLFIAMGDNVDADAWNAQLGDLLPQPLQGARTVGRLTNARDDGETPTVGEGERLQRSERAHPVLAPLAAPHADDALKAARFSRYMLFRPAAEGAHQALLRFEGGAPALVEGKLGEGRVLVYASSIDRDWNDLPIQPVYLPLMQQAARYLARSPLEEPDPPILVGQGHEIGLTNGDSRVEVSLPSGARRLFDKERVAGRRALGFAETEEAGIYRVSVAGADGVMRPRPSASFAVTLDPAESDPTPLPPARVAALKTGGGASAGAHAPKRRVELWHALGAALLLLLLGEAILLRRK
jgi:uncharacterized membrane protein